MSLEILDEISNEVNSKPSIYKFLPNLILLFGGILILINSNIFEANLYAFGFTILTIVSILFFTNYKLWCKALAINLTIFSIVTGIMPFPIELEISINFGPIGIGINLIAVAILLWHLYVNKEELRQYWTDNSEEYKNRQLEKMNDQIKGFKKRLIRKSTSELNSMLEEAKVIPAAQEVIRIILEERHDGQNI